MNFSKSTRNLLYILHLAQSSNIRAVKTREHVLLSSTLHMVRQLRPSKLVSFTQCLNMKHEPKWFIKTEPRSRTGFPGIVGGFERLTRLRETVDALFDRRFERWPIDWGALSPRAFSLLCSHTRRHTEVNGLQGSRREKKMQEMMN